MEKQKKDFDKRQFIRLKVLLPVDFSIVRLQGDLPGLDWQKGVTRDISRGGLGLKTEEVSESTIKYLNKQNILLEVRISAAEKGRMIRIVGEVAWYEPIEKPNKRSYLIGLKYHSIKNEDLSYLLSLAES